MGHERTVWCGVGCIEHSTPHPGLLVVVQSMDMTIFFYGSNSYEMRRQLRHMIAGYIKKAGSDMGLERLDGQVVTAQQLLAALQAAPFLATSRFVIVENVSANKVVSTSLDDLMAKVPASTVVVFVERNVDQRTVAFRALKQADKVMKFEPITGPKLLSWIKSQVVGLGGSIEAPAARELIGFAGEEQWRLSGEISKLVHFQPEITVETVRELVVPSTERSIFDLVEAMTAGQTAAALQYYRALLSQKESEIYILTMIQWQLRNLLLAKLAPAGMSPPELAAEAGMSPYVAGKAAQLQGRLDEQVIRLAFADAVDTEYRIKVGHVKSELGVEQLLLRVAQAASRA
jgi:DNA polymerase III subunit delta